MDVYVTYTWTHDEAWAGLGCGIDASVKLYAVNRLEFRLFKHDLSDTVICCVVLWLDTAQILILHGLGLETTPFTSIMSLSHPMRIYLDLVIGSMAEN